MRPLFLGLSIFFSVLAGGAVAQVDPCYCIKQVSYQAELGRWITTPCGGNCVPGVPGEGTCIDGDRTVDGALFVFCHCTNAAAPNCNCIGEIRNPNYGPGPAPLIICETLALCPLPMACSTEHLLPPIPAWLPICKCN